MVTLAVCHNPACRAELTERDQRDGWCPRCGAGLVRPAPPRPRGGMLASIMPAMDPPSPRKKNQPSTRRRTLLSASGAAPRATFGKYEVYRKLSDSATSKVYEAIDVVLGRPVALKVLKLNDQANLKRFRREAQTAARIDHPNFCQIYEIGEVNGVHYLALEYLLGQTLAERLAQDPRPIPPRDAAALVRRLALAMAKAHEHNVIHRDLKPGNVMIDSQGAPIIIDFGMAKLFDAELTQLTKHGTPFGTPCYMPPEQVHGDLQAIGPPVDIYALGVVLFEILAGQRPYGGESFYEIFARITSDEPPPKLSEARPGADPQLEAICLKAMAKAIPDRYPTMTAFAEAIEGYLVATEPAGPAADRARTFTVSADGDGDYRRIGEAVRHAHPGTRIYIRPGRYAERLVVDVPLELIGDGPADRIILEGPGGPALRVECDGVKARGLTMTRTDPDGQEKLGVAALEVCAGGAAFVDCFIPASTSLAAVAIAGEGTDPTFRNCRFGGGESVGLLLSDRSRGTFEGCEIAAPGKTGMLISGESDPTLRDCRIEGCDPGIFVLEDGRGRIEDCLFRRNARAGVMVGDRGAPTIARTRFEEGGDSALFLYHQAAGQYEDCHILDHGDAGVVLLDRAEPIFRGCTSRGNGAAGIMIVGPARGTFEDCKALENRGPNLLVQSGGDPVLRGCHFAQGLDTGISFLGGKGLLENCLVRDNAGVGLLMRRSAEPQLRSCQIDHNGGGGVRAVERARGLFEFCQIHANAQAGIEADDGAEVSARGCLFHGNGEEAVVIGAGGTGALESCDLRGHRLGLWGRLLGKKGGPWRIEPGATLVRRDNIC